MEGKHVTQPVVSPLPRFGAIARVQGAKSLADRQREVLLRALVRLVGAIPSATFRRRLVGQLYDLDRDSVIDGLASRITDPMTLSDLRFDLNPTNGLRFE